MLDITEILDEEFARLRSDIVDKFHDAAASGHMERVDKASVKENPYRWIYSDCELPYPRGCKESDVISARDIGNAISYFNTSFFKNPVSSAAFLAAEKICDEKNGCYDKTGVHLMRSVVTPRRIQRIIDRIAGSYGLESYQIFINAFKNYLENGSDNMDR